MTPSSVQTPERLLRRLEWRVIRRLDGQLQGDYRTMFRGAGIDVADLREYELGDDVRHIDWNVTARMREPHVRVHIGERAMTAWLVLDVSASMQFGTALRRKADVAEGVALAVGHVATRRGNRLGVVAFGEGSPRVLRPQQGRLGLLGLLAELRQADQAAAAAHPGQSASLADAVQSMGAIARARGLVVVVSDFRGARAWEAPLRALRARHGVLAIEIRDPRELELPAMGDLWMVDPETGQQLVVNTSRRSVRERFKQAAAAERREVGAALRRAGADHLVLSTDGDWLRDLAGHLRRAEQVRRGAMAAGGPGRAAAGAHAVPAGGDPEAEERRPRRRRREREEAEA